MKFALLAQLDTFDDHRLICLKMGYGIQLGFGNNSPASWLVPTDSRNLDLVGNVAHSMLDVLHK